MVRIDTYILKVASRCNLNCRYCYIYNKGDDTYKTQPYTMSSETVSNFLSRVSTYCRERQIERASIIFHGGEPLLAGMSFFGEFITEAAVILDEGIQPTYVLETNGVLLTPARLDLFHELEIGFGISLDGPAIINDRNRINHAGSGSYAQVRRAHNMVLSDLRMRGLFGGVLTVIDLSANPLELYHHWREIGISQCDFLLPDGTHDYPPPALRSSCTETPYANWLIQIFDEWFGNENQDLRTCVHETGAQRRP